MVRVRYSIRIITNKTLANVKKELIDSTHEIKNIDITGTRNIGKTINIQIRTNSIRFSNKIKRLIETIGEVELFQIIAGKAVY
jgi:hypothetical protein